MASRFLVVLLFALASPLAIAGDHGKKDPINPDVLTAGFLESHPDLQGRLAGMKAYNKGDYKTAFRHFLNASRYADKPSQGMVADMYWAGIGVAADRALGYAWMDLAAERMYPQFVLFRERYWDALDDSQRVDAIERGQSIFAEYRDAVTKPRLNRELRRARGRMTGSRTGFTGTGLWILLKNGPGAGTWIRGSEYYAKKYWNPEDYWMMHDQIWHAPKGGHVHVGELEQAPSASD